MMINKFFKRGFVMAFFNNYKYLFLTIFILLLLCIKSYAAMGEPVPGAEIYIELEPSDEPFKKCKTDHQGKCQFTNLKKGTYKLTCKLPGTLGEWAKKSKGLKPQKLFVNFVVEGTQRAPINLGSKTGKNPLLFESPAFNLNNTMNSINVTIRTSVNNYGINDEGIK